MAAGILVVEDPAQLARAVAERLARALRAAIAERGWATLAIPAGPAARAILDELARQSLDWSEVEFYFSEERGVPADHPASAYAQATARLLENRRIASFQFHRARAEASDGAAAARQYAEELPEELDAAWLEVGPQGQLGALHAHSPAFAADAPAVVAVEVRQKPHRRLILAPSVLAGARELVALAQGAECAEAVARAFDEGLSVAEHPARLLAERAWVVDRAASRVVRA